MKTLLKKVVGEHVLRLDEFLTILAIAEATLNSRLLAPVESTSDDGIEPLTPGHFLVGGPLYALPSLPDVHSKITSLRRWNLTQRLTSELWRRGRADYLSQLQRRTKWKRSVQDIKKDDIVLLKDEDLFQRSWPMGRVSKTYPGPDNKVRVVDLFIAGKTFRRLVHKLVRLLGEDKDESSPREEDVQATKSDFELN